MLSLFIASQGERHCRCRHRCRGATGAPQPADTARPRQAHGRRDGCRPAREMVTMPAWKATDHTLETVARGPGSASSCTERSDRPLLAACPAAQPSQEAMHGMGCTVPGHSGRRPSLGRTELDAQTIREVACGA